MTWPAATRWLGAPPRPRMWGGHVRAAARRDPRHVRVARGDAAGVADADHESVALLGPRLDHRAALGGVDGRPARDREVLARVRVTGAALAEATGHRGARHRRDDAAIRAA